MHPKIINVFILINSFIKNYNANTSMETIIVFRDDIIKSISEIRDLIHQDHGERASFYVTFAICSYCDEMINNINLTSGVNITNWHLLQEEVYQRNDGGNYFFEIADIILDNPVFPRIIAQVLYLILSFDFKGCYLDVPLELERYKNRLCVVLPEYQVGDIDPTIFDKRSTQFKRIYRSRFLKVLFFASICFTSLLYFGILAIR